MGLLSRAHPGIEWGIRGGDNHQKSVWDHTCWTIARRLTSTFKPIHSQLDPGIPLTANQKNQRKLQSHFIRRRHLQTTLSFRFLRKLGTESQLKTATRSWYVKYEKDWYSNEIKWGPPSLQLLGSYTTHTKAGISSLKRSETQRTKGFPFPITILQAFSVSIFYYFTFWYLIFWIIWIFSCKYKFWHLGFSWFHTVWFHLKALFK